MGKILDIDDPLWSTLNRPSRGYGDPIEGFTKVLIIVRQTFEIPDRADYCELIQQMLDFVHTDERDGKVHAELDYHLHVQRAKRMVSVHRVAFHFEDPLAAFAFKMRFA